MEDIDTATKTHDPVCGTAVEPEWNHCHVRHHDRLYYFCSLRCLLAFAEAPERYDDAYA